MTGSLGAASCARPEIPDPPPIEKPTAPLALDEAVELALRNNWDVRASEQRVARAGAMIDEANSAYWPEVSVGGTFTRTDRPSRVFADLLDQGRFDPALDFNDPGTVSNLRTEIGAGLTLYDGGRRRARGEGARAHHDSLIAAEEAVRRDTAYEVARAWYLVHKARAAAESRHATVASLERVLEIAQARRDEGAALLTEVLEVRLELASAREAAQRAEDGIERARTALGLLLGLGVLEPPDVDEPEEALAHELDPLAELLDQARLNRPELVRAQKEIEIALASVSEAHAGYYPEIQLFGAYGWNSPELSLERANWLLGASLIEDVTNALRTPYRVRQALAGLAVVQAQGRKRLLEIEQEVQNAQLDSLEAEERYAVATELRALLRANLSRTEVEHEEGAAGLATLLDARIASVAADASGRVAGLDRALARIAVAHAVGAYPPPERAPPEATPEEAP